VQTAHRHLHLHSVWHPVFSSVAGSNMCRHFPNTCANTVFHVGERETLVDLVVSPA
jgi:hypothetical protein